MNLIRADRDVISLPPNLRVPAGSRGPASDLEANSRRRTTWSRS